MTNPCSSPQSPFSPEPDSLSERRTMGTLLAVVTANLLLNAASVVRHWDELTVAHYLMGIVLWVLLPIVALALVFGDVKFQLRHRRLLRISLGVR